jgi:ABC-type transport system substrate-binding protein
MQKAISFILISILVLLQPLSALAQSPTVTDLEKGQTAPYSGVLFNPEAAAQLLAQQKYADAECELKIDLEIDKLGAQMDLINESLKASLRATENKYESIIDIKDDEINRLTDLAMESGGNYSHWWAAGGFIVGAFVSLGIFYAALGASK